MPGKTYGGMELHYDPKCGFLLYSVTMFSSGFYLCHGEFYEKENFATYQLIIMRKGFFWMCLDLFNVLYFAFGLLGFRSIFFTENLR